MTRAWDRLHLQTAFHQPCCVLGGDVLTRVCGQNERGRWRVLRRVVIAAGDREASNDGGVTPPHRFPPQHDVGGVPALTQRRTELLDIGPLQPSRPLDQELGAQLAIHSPCRVHVDRASGSQRMRCDRKRQAAQGMAQREIDRILEKGVDQVQSPVCGCVSAATAVTVASKVWREHSVPAGGQPRPDVVPAAAVAEEAMHQQRRTFAGTPLSNVQAHPSRLAVVPSAVQPAVPLSGSLVRSCASALPSTGWKGRLARLLRQRDTALMTAVKPTVVLVHGSWHGPWAWDKVGTLLSKCGYRVIAVALPGVHRAPGDITFAGHCSYLKGMLNDLNEDVVLVGHSYAGALLSEVGDAGNVVGLLFVSGFCLDAGESVGSVNDAEQGSESGKDSLMQSGDLLLIGSDAAVKSFYHDCAAEDIANAVSQLTPEHVSTRTATVSRAAWRHVASHYVVCTEDRAIVPTVQRRLAARAGSTRELPTSHSPMLSAPRQLADMISAFAQSVTTQAAGLSASAERDTIVDGGVSGR